MHYPIYGKLNHPESQPEAQCWRKQPCCWQSSIRSRDDTTSFLNPLLMCFAAGACTHSGYTFRRIKLCQSIKLKARWDYIQEHGSGTSIGLLSENTPSPSFLFFFNRTVPGSPQHMDLILATYRLHKSLAHNNSAMENSEVNSVTII